ncbi:MAG TPA: methyl-accepting chemotaxis protein, partial [Noviherbaspirillum sp.]|nr:methyl-accepting chemotaxis protein [Noviherbaspirillum sp.]
MKKTISLKKLFTLLLVAGAVLATFFVAALYQVSRTQAELVNANEMRYRSYLLADELRQSSDDLTRLART